MTSSPVKPSSHDTVHCDWYCSSHDDGWISVTPSANVSVPSLSVQLRGTHIGSPPLQLWLVKQVPLLDPCNL